MCIMMLMHKYNIHNSKYYVLLKLTQLFNHRPDLMR